MEYIRPNNEGFSKVMTIRERHENTKEKLNQLVINAQNNSSQNMSNNDISVTEDLADSKKEDRTKNKFYLPPINNPSSTLLIPQKTDK